MTPACETKVNFTIVLILADFGPRSNFSNVNWGHAQAAEIQELFVIFAR